MEEKNTTVKETVPDEKLVSLFRLFSYADTLDWILMALGTVGAIVHGMAQPVGYLLLGRALDAFGSNIHDNTAMVSALKKVIPFVWYLAIATLPAGLLEVGCWMYTCERQVSRIRLAFLGAVLNQEIEAFDTDLTSGKIITGITNHMNLIQDAIGEKMGHFLSSFSAFFSGIVIAFICCWQVGMLALLVVPLVAAIGATYTSKMNGISTLRMTILSEATSIVEQTITQIKTVFSYVGECSTIRSFSNCMDQQFKLSKVEAVIKGVGLGMFHAVTFNIWGFIVYIGAVTVSARESTGGETIAAVMSILFGAISLTYAAPDLQLFGQAKVAGKEVFQVIGRKQSISCKFKGEKFEKINGDIDIRDVYFAYPSRSDRMILEGFSLSIPAGKVVALVGSSGCGKSTILSLLQRFYNPLRGNIFIDNHNIKTLDLKFLRKNIGAVMQEPCLFVGTIKDNLKVGNMDADDKTIEEAAAAANAHSFISQLPEQYATQVGERGIQLSGGQKQRVAIARAILKDPPILLFDEATSALDSESEKQVQDALEMASKGRTVILIAHRISTVVNADIIAVVENGKLSEAGKHQQLLHTNKFYNMLVSMQNLHPGTGSRNLDLSEETQASTDQLSAEEFDLSYESKDRIGQSTKSHLQEVPHVTDKAVPFFRIWFGLNKLEIIKIVFGSSAAALSGISKPVFGFFIMTIGVAYYQPHAKRQVGWYSIAFCLIGFLALVTHILQHYFYGVVGEKAMRNLREALYSAVLRNEIAWFEKPENNASRITSRIINDTTMIKTIISDRMSVIVQCISSILIATAVSMKVNWRMGLVAWAVMPCHFIGGLIQAKSAKGFSSDFTVAHDEIVALASESSTNIRTIASFTYEDQMLHRAQQSLKEPMRKSRMESLKYGVIQGISLCLWNSAHAVALWYTTILVKKNQASFENGIRSYQIFSLTVPSITELWTLVPTVISAIRLLSPAFEILDRETQIDPDIPSTSSTGKINGQVEFKKVDFSYPSRPDVTILKIFSLSIEAGSKVALVGPSGGGKSSVLALILRFYDPCDGQILIDKKNIREYNLKWLRTQIALVQQEPLLFSSSIRENICYGNEGISEAELVEVAQKANIHQFISNLPNGYDTVVGEKGCQLSGGQKQRIAVARALLKRPAIMLLDEATSALDAESERAVMSALEMMAMSSGLLSKCTQITVAHRLATIVNSDIIVVMDRVSARLKFLYLNHNLPLDAYSFLSNYLNKHWLPEKKSNWYVEQKNQFWYRTTRGHDNKFKLK
ncbi:hypothetical protein H6P81_008260 [Aristolochia fimbriata]|uniref:Uncharacterized protein n=1 Tax=Aristolochia fimbriata TaxID=158543 RepID=A0AAV7F699_ARIFI|nr:hypothetical protein H6P81_008260 [Aristolochia fimbriata]